MAKIIKGKNQGGPVTANDGIRVQGGVLTEGYIKKGGHNPPAVTTKPSTPPAQRPASQSPNSTVGQSPGQPSGGQPAAITTKNRDQK